jgi:hypothetical protein
VNREKEMMGRGWSGVRDLGLKDRGDMGLGGFGVFDV